jgi:hypothetical protein
MALSSKQKVAIAQLADGASVQSAADTAGVHRRTVTGWKVQPAFAAELRQVQFSALEQLSARLLRQADQVAVAVGDGLVDPDIGIKLRAAQLWLDRVPGLLQLVDFEARLAALEMRINESETT